MTASANCGLSQVAAPLAFSSRAHSLGSRPLEFQGRPRCSSLHQPKHRHGHQKGRFSMEHYLRAHQFEHNKCRVYMPCSLLKKAQPSNKKDNKVSSSQSSTWQTETTAAAPLTESCRYHATNSSHSKNSRSSRIIFNDLRWRQTKCDSHEMRQDNQQSCTAAWTGDVQADRTALQQVDLIAFNASTHLGL